MTGTRERSHDEWRSAYLARHRPKSDRSGVIKGPCPVCGGEDRFELRKGTRGAAVAAFCRHCGKTRFGDIASALFGGGEDLKSFEPPPTKPDPWRHVPCAEELSFWLDHPVLRNAAELYPYKWPGGQLAAIEVKNRRADGRKGRPWICRPSALGLVFGITSGTYRWDSRRQVWRKPREGEPRPRVRYRRFERVDLPLYRAHLAERERCIVHLCAGPKDAEAGALVGLSTVAQAGGEGRRLQMRARRLLAAWGREVKVIFDHDETGREGAERAAKDLRDAGCSAAALDIETVARQSGHLEKLAKGFDLADLVEALIDPRELAREYGLRETLPESFGVADLIAWRLWRCPPAKE